MFLFVSVSYFDIFQLIMKTKRFDTFYLPNRHFLTAEHEHKRNSEFSVSFVMINLNNPEDGTGIFQRN